MKQKSIRNIRQVCAMENISMQPFIREIKEIVKEYEEENQNGKNIP